MSATATLRTLLLVGDRFAGFAAQQDVLTVSQFIEEMRLGVYSWDSRPVRVRAGQGVTTEDADNVRDAALLLGLGDRLDLDFRAPALAGRGEAHKHRSDNTLIADLRRDGADLFSATLRVHNDNELLIDHQTGEHVQGMVAVEAARQMFLAVSERYHACRYLDRSYYYVIESMNTDFENFLFPVDATIVYHSLRAELDDPDRLSFAAEISLHQAGRRASITTVTYTAFDAPVIEAKEHRRAQFAVEHTVRNARQTITPAEPVLATV
ncbi:AfsA-related hotdog domain-containing protein [Streptomyces justiciae]|uniref:AfsA-related hotdog domain-containing protein n=1 Tax=Streptomyces justiciae TaxID=2780140 RepID=A0ABU3M4L4_9ACTN|nr:AfsA-related hotdog domain-containing protein [Streptomyces justiciae]MDT7846343.1 AfsA-related hotdog domain-containing protein [Streptomyces justiciae]